MNMKKTTAVLLACALAVVGFAGCGNSASSGSVASASTPALESGSTTAESTDGAASEKTKVQVWCWDPNFNVLAAQTAAELYADINPNVEVVVTEVASAEIYTRLTAAATSGQRDTLPDIMLIHDRNIVKYVTSYDGVFAPFDNSGIDFSEFADYKVTAATANGSVYAVPFDSGASVTAMRTDLLEEAGYTIDDFTDITWSRFIEIGKDIYAKTGRSLLIDRSDTTLLINTMLQSTGSWYFNENSELTIEGNEALREVYSTYKEMVDSNVLVRYNDGESFTNALWDDSSVGTVNACWILASVMKAEDQSGLWSITNTPRLDNVPGAKNDSNNGGSSWLVVDNENKEIAMDYLKQTFAGSKELYNTILPKTSAIATWLPAQDGSNYNAPQTFFGGQQIYKMIMEYSVNIPQINYAVHSDEAYQASNTAIASILSGTDIDAAMKEAQNQVAFQMQ